ncbi:MAG: sugar ABC transporter ATP-binding protein [Peptoniphilaceae bacterium]|nr:sugar ABC transporter ATP-binding protein [Peptoniphilaceae bacterium]
MTKSILLEMKNISKEFPGVKALDRINFDLQAGEVHAILGENGAGKSTLIKVLGGIYKPEEGEIYIEGQPISIQSVLDAQKQGIAIIHQEIVLVSQMTIAQNIFLGRELMTNGVIDQRKMEEETQKLLTDFQVDLRPWDIVRKLSIAQQQMVEIMKAIYQDARILVMDEPTSSISDKEVEFLFDLMRKLTAKGVGIIYISHKMAELEKICDRVSVFRDGQSVATCRVDETSSEELINLMVGRELTRYYVRNYQSPGSVALEVKHLKNETSEDLSFVVHQKEIVGFAGLVGAGRSELMESIFGLTHPMAGEILVHGKAVSIHNPTDAVRCGIAYVPEERRKDGLYLQQSVSYNTTIQVLSSFLSGGRYNQSKEKEIAENYTQMMRTKTPSLSQHVEKLSGGNQQKVLIGRWLATRPDILILDEPTRGVDVGAKAEIYAIINDLAAQGMAIIIISSELPEIINMADRVYVMRDGVLIDCLDHEDISQEKIMKLAAR